MKRIAMITATLLLISSVCFGQMRTPRITTPPSPITGNATDGYSLGGSLAITSTNPSTIPSLESGNSKYAINGNGTIALTGLNRTYTIALATSPTLQIAALDAQTYWMAVQNQTVAGSPGGVTIWSTDPIRGGFGAVAWSGNTIWANGTGNTGYQIPMEAMVDPNGVKYWRVRDTQVTINHK